MLTELIGYFAGFCSALCFLPQVTKTWRTKAAEDVSMGMLGLLLASGIGYEWYAFRLDLMPVVVMNGIFTALVLFEVALKVKYDLMAKP